jgi:hypothetical protein
VPSSVAALTGRRPAGSPASRIAPAAATTGSLTGLNAHPGGRPPPSRSFRPTTIRTHDVKARGGPPRERDGARGFMLLPPRMPRVAFYSRLAKAVLALCSLAILVGATSGDAETEPCGRSGTCIDCSGSASGPACINGQCAPGCSSEQDCPAFNSCNLSTHVCDFYCNTFDRTPCNGGCCYNGLGIGFCTDGMGDNSCGNGGLCAKCQETCGGGTVCVSYRCTCQSDADCVGSLGSCGTRNHCVAGACQ